jgi:hypothetical protein
MIPFSEDEMKVVGQHITTVSFGPFPAFIVSKGVPKRCTPVKPKENLRLCIDRKQPFWFPVSMDIMDFEPRINPDTVARAMIIDMEPAPEKETGGKDLFGVNWIYVPEAGGSMVRPGSAILDDVNVWESIIKFPDIDALDWESCKEKNAILNTSERALHTSLLNGLFERLISFMDFENAAVAIIDEDQEDAIHALFDRLVDMYINILDHYLEFMKLDGLLMHDDWGSQRAPFFSPDVCRRMIAPHMKRFVDYCHSKGLWFELHCCGKNELLVPVMIECGIDIWRPQQINNITALHEQYGDKIILGMPGPSVTKDSTDEEIDCLVREFVEKYAPTFREKPFLTSAFGADSRFYEALYRYSRIELNKYTTA